MDMDFICNECTLNVADFVKPNSGKDVSDELQKLIDSNPNKTLFFADGEYLLSKPICTSANPIHAVSFKMSTFAKLKATDDWTEQEALVRIGAAEPFNNITTPGSNYYFEGGILDGNCRANGISIDSGRETCIKYVSIKNAVVGLHIKIGANGNSSDADICNVNIIGADTPDSIGVLIDGNDNTLTNMRITKVQIGVKLNGAGNYLRNIHPLHCMTKGIVDHYKDSVAFLDNSSGSNWYDFCYSDQMAVGFSLPENGIQILHNCFAMWWTAVGGHEVGIKCSKRFNAIVKNYQVHLMKDSEHTNFLEVGESGGKGVLEDPVFVEELSPDKSYLDYLRGKIIRP